MLVEADRFREAQKNDSSAMLGMRAGGHTVQRGVFTMQFRGVERHPL